MQELYAKMLEHQQQWTADRAAALAIRRSLFLRSADAIYECDDKCGSYWQAIPADPTGRQGKAVAGDLYRFAIQANVVSGKDGIVRFAFVPKHVATGGNFGLTNLIMVLLRAKENGCLGSHVKKMYRHTDGGPDNVSVVTHILHWLLVYLGVFDEIEWFRFESGHSHTEIADRLFSLMKRLFDTDSAARARSVGCPSELAELLRSTFERCDETFKFDFNWANWQIEEWLVQMTPVDATPFTGKMARFSFDNVFRYQYLGETHAFHGGVKVTYKDRLSRVGTSINSEWGPIEKVKVPGPTAGSAEIEKTTEQERGIVFIPYPPDLRREPRREDWVEEKEGGAAKACRKALQNRHQSDLTQEARKEWKVLASFHEQYEKAHKLPQMPHTQAVTGDSSTASFLPANESAQRTLEGSPMELLPILKQLMRFERPLITWNIFGEKPPAAFPQTAKDLTGAASTEACPSAEQARQPEKVRDPRVVNNVVHLEHRHGEWRRGQQDVSNSEWVEDVAPRLEEDELADGHFYIVRLHDADGELYLGLVKLRIEKLIEGRPPVYIGRWFARVGKSHAWPSHVKFGPYMDGNTWVEQSFDVESFLLEVQDDNLTSSSTEESPTLSAAFVERLKLFARKHHSSEAPLLHTKQQAAPKAAAPPGTTTAQARTSRAAQPPTNATSSKQAAAAPPKPAAAPTRPAAALSKPAVPRPKRAAAPPPKPSQAAKVQRKR